MQNPSTNPWIETFSGIEFNLLEPEFDILDIATALSRLCRYAGHCKEFYSVAEHSVIVSHLVPPDWAREALLHDATEAYLVDIPSPWKAMMPEYKSMEADLHTKMAEHFGIPTTISHHVKVADYRALFLEAEELVPSRGITWLDKYHQRFDRGEGEPEINCYPPNGAYFLFLERYAELS